MQVMVPGGGLCRGQVLHKPRALPPATSYALLGGGQSQVVRQAALVGLWSMQLLRRGLAAFDRANTSGIEDTLLVWHVPDVLCLSLGRECGGFQNK